MVTPSKTDREMRLFVCSLRTCGLSFYQTCIYFYFYWWKWTSWKQCLYGTIKNKEGYTWLYMRSADLYLQHLWQFRPVYSVVYLANATEMLAPSMLFKASVWSSTATLQFDIFTRHYSVFNLYWTFLFSFQSPSFFSRLLWVFSTTVHLCLTLSKIISSK